MGATRPASVFFQQPRLASANALDIDPRDMFFPTNENEKENNSYSLNSSDDEQVENAMQESQPVNTTAFCPHCGAKVRVGVVLMTE